MERRFYLVCCPERHHRRHHRRHRSPPRSPAGRRREFRRSQRPPGPPGRPAARRARRRRTRGRAGPPRLLGRRRAPPRLGHRVAHHAFVDGPGSGGRARSGDPLVRGRRAERGGELCGPARGRRPGGQGRPALRGRARRPHHRDLRRPAAPRGPGRERTRGARHHRRRPRGGLPARAGGDDRHHSGLRPDRGGALAGVRRVLGGGAEVPRGGHRRQAPGHHGRSVPPRQGRSGQSQRGRGGVRSERHRARPGDRPHRPQRPHHARGRADPLDPRTRPLVARAGGPPAADPHRARLPRRDAAVHHVHLRHHREAQGTGPHLRRLPHAGQLVL